LSSQLSTSSIQGVDPFAAPPDGTASAPTATGASSDGTTAWYNEEVAEQDPVLAAISEAAEMYVTSVLEKAVFCGRQRLQLDGIRIWYENARHADEGKGQDGETGDPEGPAPPLGLVLGSDVTRQVARAAGNAALTCKRMEEALERQEGVPSRDRVLDDDTLATASSMSEIALRPRLADGAGAADVEAKRLFEIYGGKHAMDETPLGRVPKKARLEVSDFQLGMQLVAGHSRRQRAFPVSASFFF
jgi:hypothetical protein